MYAFLRRPAWIVSHVLVVLGVLAMVGLGLWQRQRWIDERAKSEALEAQSAGTPVPLDEALADVGVSSATPPASVPESVEFRRVVVRGTYDAAHEVMVRNRSREGAPGEWVMTPLVQADGTAVAVVRGWVPFYADTPAPPFPGTEPPGGEVTVTGLVQRSQAASSFGGADPTTGALRSLARADIPRLDQQVDAAFAPVYVVLDGQDPPQPAATEGLPDPVHLDIPTPETNFSYMVQWWIFAFIAAAGYPLVLRRVASGRERGDQTPVEDDLPVTVPDTTPVEVVGRDAG